MMLAATARSVAPIRQWAATSCAAWSRSHARCIHSAGVVGFGKYKGQTFEDILQQDKSYGAWVLKACESPDANPSLQEFGMFLKEQAPELTARTHSHEVKGPGPTPAYPAYGGLRVVGFGKYKGQAFEEVLQRDKQFCAWVLKVSAEPDQSPAFAEFGMFLQEHAPELMAPAGPARSREAKGSGDTVAPAFQAYGSDGAKGVVSFGKYRGQTFETVFQQDKNFCEWVLKTCVQPDAGQALRDFGTFLQEREPEMMAHQDAESKGGNAAMAFGSEGDAVNVVTFGKYKGQSYEKVFQSDLEWCRWVVGAADTNNSGHGLLAFAKFLRTKDEFM